jgi:hypothetical protein
MSQPAHAPGAPVNTAKVAGPRLLRFESIDQALAEVERIVEAERAGRLKRLGNWTTVWSGIVRHSPHRHDVRLAVSVGR